MFLFFIYLCSMMTEIFKVQYAKYFNEEYFDFINLDEVHQEEIDNSVDRKGKSRGIFRRKGFNDLEETYITNYGNPLYTVTKEHLMVVVERDENKVSLKYFIGYKQRRVGKSWFKITKNMHFITVNLKTGDIYNGALINYQKKKCSKRLRRNTFINDPLNVMKSHIKHLIDSFKVEGDSYGVTIEALSKFMFEVDQRQDFGDLNFSQRLYRFYLNSRGVKYPNNFGSYLKTSDKLPILKDFRKHNNKYVDAFMKINDVSGKKLRKVLHTASYINLSVYRVAISFFGEDWINQNEELLSACVNSSYRPHFTTQTSLRDVFSPEELKRVFEIFKQVFVKETLDYSTFFDHVRLYIELKAFGEEEIRWYSCEDKDDFRKEHLDWTDKVQHYKQGTYTRIYPEYMHKVINKTITIGGDTYYPVLLTNSSVYNMESQLQSNCVKGYIGKTSSIIVSLRKGSVDSDVRGTIEYSLFKDSEGIEVSRVQYLGRFNERLGEEWIRALLKLDLVMNKCIDDKRYENVKLKKECANGVILHSDSEWNKWGGLEWTQKNIQNNNYTIFDNIIDF
jgi:hypothetical protein